MRQFIINTTSSIRFWGILALGAFAILFLGCKCDDKPVEPSMTADQLAAILQLAAASVEAGQAAAINDKNFDACLGTGIGKGLLETAAKLAPEIESEVKDPDGKLDIASGTIDLAVCKPFAPEPWPPKELKPLPDQAKTIVTAALSLASSTLRAEASKLEGEDCIRATVGAAVVDSVSKEFLNISDEVAGPDAADLVYTYASFHTDYSGCGVDLPEEPEKDIWAEAASSCSVAEDIECGAGLLAVATACVVTEGEACIEALEALIAIAPQCCDCIPDDTVKKLCKSLEVGDSE